MGHCLATRHSRPKHEIINLRIIESLIYILNIISHYNSLKRQKTYMTCSNSQFESTLTNAIVLK